MNTQKLAVIIVFVALTVALNPALTGVGVPAPYAPYLVYQIWEIPLVAVFLLYGPKYGISIAVLNTLVLLAIYMGPGGLPAAPFYNLAAFLSMILGVFSAHKASNLRAGRQGIKNIRVEYGTAVVVASTALGIVLRTAIMSVVNYAVLGYGYPIGYSLPESAVLASLPFIALFNATLALYTVPVGHVVANVVKSRLRLNNEK
ncbi:MAG: hypothetical protein ACE14S_03635 [Candidatus Bathyarchaeia archaeon]